MRHKFDRTLPFVISAIVLAILGIYTYTKLWVAPYMGFHLRLPAGEISLIYAQSPAGSTLQEGDRLLQAGSVTWEAYEEDLRQPLFERVRPGDQVTLRVLRNNQEVIVPWIVTEPTFREIIDHLDMLWLPYLFWAVGTAVLFLIRPRDTLWRLLVAFNYLTAVWLIAGIASGTALWHSAIVMRMAIWLCWPVYWHLHWHFPKALGRLSAYLVWGLYVIAGLIAVSEWFQVGPSSLYALGFALALLGSVILLIVHAVRLPEQRRDLSLLALAVGIVVVPLLGLGASDLFGESAWYRVGALLALPGLPFAYFYAIYRRQRGDLEPRANRVITLILFGSLLLGLAAISTLIISRSVDYSPAQPDVVTPIFVTGLITAIAFPWFQKWVERRLLGMPLPPARLLERYSTRIITSLSDERLVEIIRDEVLPTLLIHQAALLRVNGDGRVIPILSAGVTGDQLPEAADLPELLANSGFHRAVQPESDQGKYSWVRLVLPLQVEGKDVGVCLFGKRDVDDVYAPTEIPTLQAFMDQTALALVNIEQAGQLRSLYQADIERQEAQRTRLARELHDDVLHQMSLLSLSIEEPSKQFQEAYESATTSIREIISGLRPTMLNFGLYGALKELAEAADSQLGGDVNVIVELPASDFRYPPDIELHLYRIVQQACQNALKHAFASKICISGVLDVDCANITIADDGKGFDAGERLDFNGLLAGKHYGLAGMFERAALIGARLQIDSSPQMGTRISVNWRQGQGH
ncbi:MAG: hypothetical protein EHM70_21645 [Chloroflexota bacterium]|nr:MAG: hypothetical protein EHM70_21645 [Chloroflexota bacterium]